MELVDIIKGYVLEENTDYAILINGDWGSGKTYYLKNVISKQISLLKYVIDKKTKPYQVIYVSLYGVTSAEELQKKLFLEVNPMLKTKAGKIGTTLFAKGLDFIGLGADKEDEKSLLNIFGGIPQYKILAFDDLERLEMTYSQKY